jgi:polyhydroxyalkanoate synthesis regulator phasin
MTFIDSSYESLHVHSKFTKEQAWSLLTQLVTRIFTDMAKVREGVLMSLRTQDEESTCAAVLWTVFQTHDKMDEFFNANISDHPSVSSEYVKFLASNSGFEQVDKLETQVTKLQKDLTKALEDNATVRRKADSATNLVDTLQRKVNAMEAKVSKLK